MNDPVILRGKIRKALALAPRNARGRSPLSEEMLKATVERLTGSALSVPEFRDALEWNHARNLVEFEWDADAEANYWELTRQGRAKEGLK
jgi:hypothetical protein